MQLKITTVGYVAVNRQIRHKIARCEADRLCFACEEPLHPAKGIRGLHSKCYAAQRRLIAAGVTTDAQLVAIG